MLCALNSWRFQQGKGAIKEEAKRQEENGRLDRCIMGFFPACGRRVHVDWSGWGCMSLRPDLTARHGLAHNGFVLRRRFRLRPSRPLAATSIDRGKERSPVRGWPPADAVGMPLTRSIEPGDAAGGSGRGVQPFRIELWRALRRHHHPIIISEGTSTRSFHNHTQHPHRTHSCQAKPWRTSRRRPRWTRRLWKRRRRRWYVDLGCVGHVWWGHAALTD